MHGLKLRLRHRLAASPRYRLWTLPGLPAFLGYQTHNGLVRETVRGVVFQYDPRTYIGQCLFTEVPFEDAEIDFLSSRLAAHSAPLIVDIGANVGWHAIRLALQQPHARLVAFEPNDVAATALETNLRLNHLEDRIHVERQAVADSPGMRELLECDDDAYSSMLETGRSPVRVRRQVAVTTLDRFVEERNLSEIALIKIDVEGLEWEVVQGAVVTLRRLKPDLFVEIDERNRASPSGPDLIRALLGYGYRAFVFRDGKLYAAEPDEYKFWFYNYFFTADPAFSC